MIKKENYNLDIEKIIEISKKYEIEKLKKEFKLILKESNEFKVNILFIGSFSAGKSALLNRLIGKNILEESQAPETAIATELYASEEEYIVLNKKDGSRQIITSELLKDDIENSKYTEYYVSSENIKKLSDYTIVDTPGFDSGIERHNKALMQYIGTGTAYVLVVDVEKGTLSKSVLDFIEEIIGYKSDIAIVLNKCDKKTEEEIKKIKAEVEKTLKLNFFTEMSLIEISIFDENVAEKLVTLISKFKPQDLYEKNIMKPFSNKTKMLLNGIELIIKNQEFDEDKYDKEIEEREKIKKIMIENLKDEKEEIKNNLNDKKKYEILDSIRIELISNIDKLVISYKGGEDLFKRRIVEIIRPTLIKQVETISKDLFKEIVENIDLNKIRIEDNSINIEEINNLISKLKELENDNLIKLPKRKDHHVGGFEKLDKMSGAYMGITSALAIATNVVAPALELVIVFLPLIIKLVKFIAGSSEEEQLKSEIENKVIPEILNKLENQIEEILSKLGEEAIQNIDDKINEIVNIENETLEKMKIKKLEKQEAFEKYIEDINKDFKTVKEIGEKYGR
ncbi:dynamin family protein [Leptotrichia trevisanii]|uniref:dynamin family protein n=1 Tax=Leptotrichia trevisanii TaxID=109328 RepID=UPI0026F215F6|nr:dynamin family protein [Leptotrichia trevisanii]